MQKGRKIDPKYYSIIRYAHNKIFLEGFRWYTSKLERSALLNVIREMSLSISDGHRQQTTFDRVRTINAPSPSTL